MPVVSFKTHIGSSERQKIAEKRLKDDLRVYANMDKKAVSQVMKSMKGRERILPLSLETRSPTSQSRTSSLPMAKSQPSLLRSRIRKTPGPRSGPRMSGGGGHHSNEQPRDDKGMWT